MVRLAVLFLDVLRDYLRGLENAPSAPVRAGMPTFDLPAARRHFLEAVERLEKHEHVPKTRSSHDSVASSADHARWGWFCHERSELDAFLRLIAHELSVALCAGVDAETLQVHVHRAVDV